MANQNQPPQTNPNPNRRWTFDGKATAIAGLGLTALASIGGTVAANETHELPASGTGITQSVEINGTAYEVGADIGMQDAIPGPVDINLPGIEMWAGQSQVAPNIIVLSALEPHTTIETQTKSESQQVQLMEWARLFDADPAAVEPRGMEQIQETVATIKRLLDEGYSIDEITFTGTASDEDDHAVTHGGTNPGFGKDSEKNIKLANKRAKAVRSLVAGLIKEELTPDQAKDILAEFETEKGIEIQDPELVDNIDSVAEDLGMTTVDLVMQYNRNPDSLPKSAQKILNGLRQDRFVKIEISASKVETQTEYKKITIGEFEKGGEDSKGVKLVIIPLIIPILRRRPDQTPKPPLVPEGSGRTPVVPIMPIIPRVTPAYPGMGSGFTYKKQKEHTTRRGEMQRPKSHLQPLRGSNFPSRGGKTMSRQGRGR
jgi:hypothetical protein